MKLSEVRWSKALLLVFIVGNVFVADHVDVVERDERAVSSDFVGE